ncbi:M61 family metallopeptidase [Sphingosinithalassobacter sp. LHW66-3]|uniref:M61 family metallopeptidase n=1 Tax=Sphingosinithalassobacter sp. LHW66-3 TaxID=3424718 RepID=UPI003D6A91E8
MRNWATGAAVVALAMAGSAHAQDTAPDAPVSYDVSFPEAEHHEARITVTYRDLPAEPATFRMSRSSPGRYAIHEFAKNVYSVSAVDGAGNPLPIARTDPYSWTVPEHDGTVAVSYTLYADRADGTYSQIDTTHAHLNMPATFLWAEGQEERRIRVRFEPLEGADWKIATQLPAVDGEANAYWAPNLQYFMDSPTELSDHMVREWQVGDQTIRLAIHHQGSAESADRFAEMAKRVVNAQIAVWGELPRFDYGTYTFIADYLPWVSGDGMEHRNSTILSNTRGLEAANYQQIGTLSHEFIHAWNVERLRPAELQPFDFTQANPTPSLWFAEGFTSYYAPLALIRAGEWDLGQFLNVTGGTLNYIVNAPGRRYGSPQEMSLRAPFVDAATAIDPVNESIFTSYYPYGQIIGLALDLTLRQRFEGVTLDDYMRLLWETHGRSERPYTPDDLRAALAQVTGDAAFAEQFFAETIEASGLPDFAPLLAQAGLSYELARPTAAWAGPVGLEAGEGGVRVTQAPPPGSPLYAAGVDTGDTILAVDGAAVADPGAWSAATQARAPGDRVVVTVRRRDGSEVALPMTYAADPAITIVPFEAKGMPLTDAQRAFRQAWLGTAG